MNAYIYARFFSLSISTSLMASLGRVHVRSHLIGDVENFTSVSVVI